MHCEHHARIPHQQAPRQVHTQHIRQGIYLKIQLGWEFSYENDKTWHIGRILHSESIAGWCQADFYQLHLQNSIVFNMVAIRSPSWIWRHFENIKHFFQLGTTQKSIQHTKIPQ